jgi:hypothetical protein
MALTPRTGSLNSATGLLAQQFYAGVDFIPQSGIYEFGYRSGHPVQYLNNVSHGVNLGSTSGEPEFVAQ